MAGVGKACGHADQSVALTAHFPAQPLIGLDGGRDCPGLPADFSGACRRALGVHG